MPGLFDQPPGLLDQPKSRGLLDVVTDFYRQGGVAGLFGMEPADVQIMRSIQASRDAMARGDRKGAVMAYADNPAVMMLGTENLAGKLGNAIKAYHGSPHDFDAFSMQKIGTGEGAQAYGHGLYFAEKEGVAKAYRDDLTAMRAGKAERALDRAGGDVDRAIAQTQEKIANLKGLPNAGNDPARQARFIQYNEETLAELSALKRGEQITQGRMYEVNINASADDMLDWDKPLSQQSEKVQRALAAADESFDPKRIVYEPEMRGSAVYERLKGTKGSAAEATQYLKSLGIPGLKYLDQGSRAAGEGSRNFVAFDDSLIEILRKYGLAGLTAGLGAGATLGQSEEQY